MSTINLSRSKMKIISKFTDYYDSVGRRFQGVPGQKIWLREERENTNQNLIHTILSELNLTHSLVGYTLFRKNDQELSCESCVLLVAGKVFPFIKITKKTPISFSENYYYEFSEFISEIHSQINRYRLKEFHDLLSKRYMSLSLEVWNELQSPLLLLKRHSYHSNYFIKNVVLVENPSLKEFEFYKIKDPFTCYQELDQFLTKLTTPEMEHPQIEDIYRLVEHGFDKKVSFRKRKLG